MLEFSQVRRYNCIPAGAEDPDPAVCGARTDTVEVGRWDLSGRLAVIEVLRTPVPGTDSAVVNQAITVEGEVEETRCEPECSTSRVTRRASIQRRPTSCESFPRHCADIGDTVVVVVLEIEAPDGFSVIGFEDDRGDMAVEFHTFTTQSSPIPSRQGIRLTLSLGRG